MMDKKLDTLEDEVGRITEVLGAERQALWTVLRASTLHKLEYWLGTVHPSLMTGAASRMDSLLLRLLECSTGATIPQAAPPRLQGAGEWPGFETIIDIPVDGLRGKSFQWWVSQIPIKLGGLGVRLQTSLSPMSYLGSVEKCLPSFANSNLSHLYAEGEPDPRKWSLLVESGSKLGAEFTMAWNTVRGEAVQCCNFLGEALPEVFSPTAEGFGQGAVSGSRQKMVESRELLLAATLGKGLSQYVDQSAMAVKAWKNRDKISTAFLLELPGPHNSWPSAEWSEALCLILSLPSNACISTRNLGQPIGNRFVDLYGCEVLCATLPGGSWTRRHDRVKVCLSSLAVYCGLGFVCEPYSLFSAHLQQRPLNRVQAHQARQALRPDFLFQLKSPTGDVEQVIADVKPISLGNKSYYKPGFGGNKAVTLRASQLQGEYRRGALKVDRELGHPDGNGPTVRKLESYPPVLDLVCGAYGETSDGVKKLLDRLAESRVNSLGLRTGSLEAGKELSLVTSYLRRRLSSSIMRANVKCLLERLVMVGEGQGQAGRRRLWARREEEQARLEREAQWHERLTGRNLSRRGDFPSL